MSDSFKDSQRKIVTEEYKPLYIRFSDGFNDGFQKGLGEFDESFSFDFDMLPDWYNVTVQDYARCGGRIVGAFDAMEFDCDFDTCELTDAEVTRSHIGASQVSEP